MNGIGRNPRPATAKYGNRVSQESYIYSGMEDSIARTQALEIEGARKSIRFEKAGCCMSSSGRKHPPGGNENCIFPDALGLSPRCFQSRHRQSCRDYINFSSPRRTGKVQSEKKWKAEISSPVEDGWKDSIPLLNGAHHFQPSSEFVAGGKFQCSRRYCSVRLGPEYCKVITFFIDRLQLRGMAGTPYSCYLLKVRDINYLH